MNQQEAQTFFDDVVLVDIRDQGSIGSRTRHEIERLASEKNAEGLRQLHVASRRYRGEGAKVGAIPMNQETLTTQDLSATAHFNFDTLLPALDQFEGSITDALGKIK